MDKEEKLMFILAQLQELYPHLDRLMISDLENPDRIVIATEAAVLELIESQGIPIEQVNFVEEEEPTPDELDMLIDSMNPGDDDGEDGNGGLLH